MKTSSQKCKSCEKWDEYPVNSEAVLCHHCKQPINPEAFRILKQREAHVLNEEKRKENAWLNIKPTDSIFLVALKRFLYVLELIYLAIVSIVIWIVVWLPG